MSLAQLSTPHVRDSALRRLRPGTKLLGLVLFSVATLAGSGWIPALSALILACLFTALSGQRWREVWRYLRIIGLMALAIGAFQMWQRGWEPAFEVSAELLALVLAAHAVTASTPSDELLTTVTRALGPLRRWGVRPERVALACSLALRTLPLAAHVAQETRAAARARGLESSPRAFLIPFVVRMVAHAHATGDALHARGVGDASDG